MVTLNVNFENSNKFYFEGEKLTAKLEVSIDQPTSISSILAYFIGECSCNTDIGLKNNSKNNGKNEKELYFNDMLPLFFATDEQRSSFCKGVHSYTMEYQLPSCLPTSVESPQGYIRYMVHVLADIGDRIIKSIHYFTVVSKVDLNSDVSANVPIILWKHENPCIFSFICSKNGSLRAFVHISKKGFVPGELLTINAEVRNFNRLPINWVKASIVQILKYNCAKVIKRKRVVAEVTRGCIMPYETQAWRSENIFIPAIPPTTCPPKRMINIKYKFYFLIKTSWQEKTISLKQNIIIGAVPLMEYIQAEERGQGEGEGVLNNYSYHYSNLESCIFGPHCIEEENSASSFSPLYPMYTELYNV